MIPQHLKVRNGLLLSVLLLAFYFASIHWCLRARRGRGGPVPIVIHVNGVLKAGAPDGPQGQLPVQEALGITHLDSLVNGQRLSASYIKGHQNEDVLFFNRVPKTGSEMVVLLLQWLQKENGFRHHRLKNSGRRFLSFEEQLDLAAEIGEALGASEGHAASFDRHAHFTNFTQIGLKMPLLVNVVRDPVEKIASRFYYARATPRPGGFTPPHSQPPRSPPPFFSLEECVKAKGEECTFLDGHLYDLTIPYFCGHQRYCRELNNVAALLTAKRNAEQWYAAIGVLEDLNSTLTVFEGALPRFFKGVTSLYFEELHGLHHNKNVQKRPTPDWVLNEIRYNLSHEYEFYYFIKQRLHEQYGKLLKTI